MPHYQTDWNLRLRRPITAERALTCLISRAREQPQQTEEKYHKLSGLLLCLVFDPIQARLQRQRSAMCSVDPLYLVNRRSSSYDFVQWLACYYVHRCLVQLRRSVKQLLATARNIIEVFDMWLVIGNWPWDIKGRACIRTWPSCCSPSAARSLLLMC